jgi:hypothetical protein
MSDEIQKNISRLAFRHGITLGHLKETGGRELECVLERFDAQAAEIERLRARVEELEQKRISASDAFRMVMALWGAGFREGELECRPSVSDATLKKINDRSERCKSAIISALTWEAKP